MKNRITPGSNGYLPLSSDSTEKTTTTAKPDTLPKDRPLSENDEWLGVATCKTRHIAGTPFYWSRLSKAMPSESQTLRLNDQGYDKDDPKDAMVKYETAHPESFLKKIWNGFTDAIFSFFPKLLSLTAGTKKQRIDQKVVLNIVRQSVDQFPELKIRMSQEAFNLLDIKDQHLWHEKMAIIRQAQHDYIVNKLAEAYPGHIDQNAPTILYSGGRAAGCLRVLYCSVDEYVALYWSDWGLMSVDSGAYKAHVYDYITEGCNKNWNAQYLDFNAKNFELTEPGEYTFLGKGNRKIWSFEGPCGMVDHGLGNVTSMAKFAIVSNFTTTLNMKAVGDLVSTQGKAVVYEYWQRLKEVLGHPSVSVVPVTKVSAEEVDSARQHFSQILRRAEEEITNK